MAKVVENIHSLDFYSVHAKFKHLREYKDFRARTLQKQHFWIFIEQFDRIL